MRRVRYLVAMSLDGYIAGPQGEVDWITADPEIDFAAIYNQFETALIGRRSFEAMAASGNAELPGMTIIVVSRTLRPADHPGVRIISDHVPELVNDLRARPGKDIWLFGGGDLFRSLAEAGLVDTVEVAVIPVLLGGGVPLLPVPSQRMQLILTGHKLYPTGIVTLDYAIAR